MIRWLIGGVLAAVGVVLVGMALAWPSTSRSDVTDLEVGDCFDIGLDPDDEPVEGGVAEIGLVDVVDCEQPHDAQVIATGELAPDGGDYPDDAQLFAMTDRECARVAGLDDRFGILSIAPTEATWRARAGRYLCVAVAYGGLPVAGDHAAIAQPDR